MHADEAEAVRVPTALTVYYDADCAFCRRCRDWLEGQDTFVEVQLVAANGPAATADLAGLPLGAELVVVGDTGDVWIGPKAFVMCLWATTAYRAWSQHLDGRTLGPLARRFFQAVSSNRETISVLLSTVVPEPPSNGHHPAVTLPAMRPSGRLAS
jgi:predicted DCC family thiol-disulfide oxidoreductase YuxK